MAQDVGRIDGINAEVLGGSETRSGLSDPGIELRSREGVTKLVPIAPQGDTGRLFGKLPMTPRSFSPLFASSTMIAVAMVVFGVLAAMGLQEANGLSKMGVPLGAGVAALAVLVLAHVVDQRRIARRAIQSEERLAMVLEHTTDAVWSLDEEGSFTSASPAAVDLLGYPREQLLQMRAADVVSGAHMDTLYDLMMFIAKGRGACKVELEFAARSGLRLPVDLTAVPLSDFGMESGALWMARDDSGRKRFQQELNHLASRDPLTSLFNRRRFEEELNLEVRRCRRSEQTSAVLFVDLDHFKDVNDVLGHAAGDELLVRISELMQEQLRETDIVARLGGDEFTIILPQIGLEKAREIAVRLIDAIGGNEVALHGQNVPMTASVIGTFCP